jgi:hypothetical protein
VLDFPACGAKPVSLGPLGSRMKIVLLIVAVLFALAARAGEEPVLLLTIDPPTSISRSKPFMIRFTVRNQGTQGVYFKRPWKWAANGMLVRAIDGKATVVDSGTRLNDISATSVCTWFKPLRPGEEFSFSVPFNGARSGNEITFPHAGSYRLTWVYDAAHYEDESECARDGWPIFTSAAVSNSVKIAVGE